MMKHYLNCGFNLLIYGVGSKRDFINNFAQTCLSGEPLLYVNGFHSAANMKAVTNPMVNFAIKHQLYPGRKKGAMSLPDQLDIIRKVFSHINEEESGFRRYNIVIHSMDTAALKNEDY